MATTPNRRRAERDKILCRRYQFKLTRSTDADIIARLDAQENIQGYIKALIRADIANEAKPEHD